MLKLAQVVWPAAVLAIFGGSLYLHQNGYLGRAENAVAEARAAALAHARDSDIVIVGIDAESLQALNEWPWPRRHHARLLQMLRPAAPKALFVDIDFSSRSTEEDDALFERALADWAGTPVYLASHFQARSGADDSLIVTRPLERFAAHAELASVILEPGADGLVRDMRSSWAIDGETLQSIFAHETPLPEGTAVPIDFSIDDGSFGYVSFIDVVNGRVDPAALRGKTVYVGPTAIELGDIVTVPVYRALPGVVVQAFATESVREGLLRALPAGFYAVGLAFWTLCCALLFGRRGWRPNAAFAAAGFGVLAAATLVLYGAGRVVLDIAPFALALAATFIVATVRSLDEQTWRAVASALGVKRRDALLRSVVDASTDAIVCIDAQGTIRTANPATSRIFGCVHAALFDANLAEFIPGLAGDIELGLASIAGTPLERAALSATGRKLPVEITLSRVATEEGLFTAIIRDVSERQAQQRALEHQATHDPLTGLPNRTALARHLGTLLGQANARQRVALLMLDLSRFKEVNDTLGHDVGDEVLREVARRFSAQLQGRVFISRIGGDEFAVVLADVVGHGTIDEVAQRLIASLRTPIDSRGIAMEVGVNIGIAVAPDHGLDSRELLRHADVAMYAAKRHGAGSEYYDVVDDHHTVRRLGMLSELRTRDRERRHQAALPAAAEPEDRRGNERRSVGPLASSDVRRREPRRVRGAGGSHRSDSPADLLGDTRGTGRRRGMEQAWARAARRDQRFGARSPGHGVPGAHEAPAAGSGGSARAGRARDHRERDARRPRARQADRQGAARPGRADRDRRLWHGVLVARLLARPARALAEGRQVVRRRPRDARAESRHRRVDGPDGACIGPAGRRGRRRDEVGRELSPLDRL